jgi:two-component system, cell cycle response regulator
MAAGQQTTNWVRHPRMTGAILRDLAVSAIACGVIMGLAFPPLVVALGLSTATDAYTPLFFSITIASGVVVGAINVSLARAVVGSRLRALAAGMRTVADCLSPSATGESASYDPERLALPVDSSDELGEVAGAFNQLTWALHCSREAAYIADRFSRSMSTHVDLEALTVDALAQLMTATGSPGGVILVRRESRLDVEAATNVVEPYLLGGRKPVRRVLDREMQAVSMVDGGEMLLRLASAPGEIVDPALVAPLVFQEEPLGVVVLAPPEHVSDAIGRVALLAPTLAVAARNALTHASLERLAALDPLTECYNRRFGERRLAEELARASRSGAPLGVLMFDLDRFKDVNDTYGHLVGDQVLCECAGLARRILRDSDVLVRYGGEEFLMVLPGATSDQAGRVGSRLCQAVRDARFGGPEVNAKLTVSVGIASFPEAAIQVPDALVELADAALYRAKRAGRNRVALPKETAA